MPAPHVHADRPRLAELRPLLRPLLLLYFAVVFRSAVGIGFMSFLAVLLHERGFSVGAGGALLSAYLACGAAGGFVGGWLAGRWGARAVIVRSFFVAAPLYAAFLFVPGAAGLACLMLGSFAAQSSLPVNVAMAQELSPRHASTITSLLMGAAWGLGAVLAGPVGALADAFGLRNALLALASLLLAGGACAVLLPAHHAAAPAAAMAEPPAPTLASTGP